LFNLSQAESSGKDLQLQDSEIEHLQQCDECQAVVAVFVRLLRKRPASSLPSSNPIPRFNVGDGVAVTGPGPHRGKQGLVVEITEGAGDFVYRYRVRFPEGQSENFFGFELEIKES
jgi:hypothetical protein